MSRNLHRGQPPGVLIVDHGESFGGSVLVAGVIAARMPADTFRVHLASPLTAGMARLDAESTARFLELKKPFGYVAQAVTRGRHPERRGLARRIDNWGTFLLRLARNRGYVRAIVRYMRAHDLSILHLNNGFENLEAHMAGWWDSRRVIVHAHGGCGTSRLTRYLATRARSCIAISEGVGASLVAAGTPRSRVSVLPNPLTVDPVPLETRERVEARARFGIPPDAVVCGIVGRVIPWKGQLEFLRAAAAAMREIPGTWAAIIGDVTDGVDDYGERLRREAIQLGIGERTRFTGFQGNPRDVFGLIDVLVHSSIEPEPFGLVLTEGMAFGIPVIAADRGGPLEIIHDGIDGYLRDPRDPTAVAEVLTQLLRERSLREQIGAAARQSALARFDPDRYVSKLASLYAGVIG